MSVPKYTFPTIYQDKIEFTLRDLGTSLTDHRYIARCILKLSTHYQENTSTTPWENREFRIAYLTYFFPLNYIRNLRIYKMAMQLKFPNDFDTFIDFGCGLGSSLLAAHDSQFLPTKTSLTLIDNTAWPIDFLEEHFSPPYKISRQLPRSVEKSFAVFSYSLNEIISPPDWIFDVQHILIVEPSTVTHSRKLMTFRQQLIENGFSLWAPCTHQMDCPLLLHSQKDWCHDRAHWQQPDWFTKIENHLPIKNNTITTSYLLASKIKNSRHFFGRIIGDEQKEKGKTRWMFCRNQEREFLSWLARHGDAPDWKRGELLDETLSMDKKGNELRLSKPLINT